MTVLRKMTASLLVLSGTVLSLAQGLPSAPHLTVTQKSAFLLLNPTIRTKVGLGSAQETAILSAMESYSKEQMKLLNSRDTLDRQLQANDVQFAKKALSVIQPPQRKELLTMALKSLGVGALLDKDISLRLSLTKGQVTKIDALIQKKKAREEAFDTMVAKGLEYIPKTKAGEDPARYENERKAMIKAYQSERDLMSRDTGAIDAKIVAVLTTAQRTQWKTLTA